MLYYTIIYETMFINLIINELIITIINLYYISYIYIYIYSIYNLEIGKYFLIILVIYPIDSCLFYIMFDILN